VYFSVSPCLRGESAPLAADTRDERYIGPGVKYITVRRDAGPWVIRVIEVERLAGFLRARPALAAGRSPALEPLSAIAARASTETAYAIAAVNGDFFIRERGPSQGDALGIAVVDGEVVSTPFPRSSLVIDAEGRASVQLLRMEARMERPDGARTTLHAVNETRGADRMILYTSRFGASTRTNAVGVEVALGDLPLPVRPGVTLRGTVRAVERRKGNMSIAPDGVVLSGHGRAAAFLEGLAPGDAVSFQLDFQPPIPEGAQVLGGGPRLLRDGNIVWQTAAREERFDAELAEKRHPRTAVGINGERLLLVTVDGRQPGCSVGMTLAELASLMRELGCSDALNLDGGGSTELWVRGAIENLPSDGGERPIADALVVLSSAPKGPPVRLVVTPSDVALLAGASLPLTVNSEDQYYNPATVPAAEVSWQLPTDLGAVDGNGTLIAAHTENASGGDPKSRPQDMPAPGAALDPGHRQQPGAPPADPAAYSPERPAYRSGLLWVSHGGLRASARVRIYTRPPRLSVVRAAPGGRISGAVGGQAEDAGDDVSAIPSLVHLSSGATQRFIARAAEESRRPLAIPPGAVTWSCDPAIGTIDGDGKLTCATTPARGTVTATLLGVRASVSVTVGSVDRPIDGFEGENLWRGSSVPPAVPGSVATTEERPHGGTHALRLRYDFRTVTTTRAVYAAAGRDLGAPLALRLWVRGDGGGAWLRARLRDARGTEQTITFARRLETSEEWRELRAAIPATAAAPLRLESIYLVETRPDAHTEGEIFLDDLVGEYAPE
jgi:Phosphodiester glycosidase